MYLSEREKKILQLLIEYRQGISQEDLQLQLGVSKRTVYREISSLEKSLVPLEIQIVKPRGAGYRLVGSEDGIQELKEEMNNQDELFTLDNIQRQSAITVRLLTFDTEIPIEDLADEFEVSTTTINTDLQAIEPSLQEYDLKLERKKWEGLYIEGSEVKKRQILAGLIYSGVTEYDFFSHLELLKEDHLSSKSSNFFLKQISNEALFLARGAIEASAPRQFENVTDNQLQQTITVLAVSIDRIAMKHPIAEFPEEDGEDHQIAVKIYDFVAKQSGLTIEAPEIDFLARQLGGVNYKLPQNIFLDTYDVVLSYQVKELINEVTKNFPNDFRKDEQLFYDLMAHMAAAMRRTNTLFQKSDNPLLEKIIQEYYDLYQVIEAALKREFPEFDFSQDERAYVLIHFATSMERNPSKLGLSALVLCSSGIGTSRILKSRLRKFVPELASVRISRISEMSQIDFQGYDMILSTIFLPGFNLPYKLISPLLLDDELKEIRKDIATRQKKGEHHPRIKNPPNQEEQIVFEEIHEAMRNANLLLSEFSIKAIKAEEDLSETVGGIIDTLGSGIVLDPDHVTEEVMKRYRVAPVGIPNTNLALFHSANPAVKVPFFSIYDLDQPFEIMGMDKKPMALQRILLLLAPEDMSESQRILLGKISNSIIESDLNTELYKHGNQEIIYQLLSSLFVDEIRGLK